jgi:UDP-N-acetylglucosamine acyltransferase
MIHPSAVVHPHAQIAGTADIGPFCIIGDAVTIGEHTRLLANVIVNGHTTIGDEVTVYPFATIGAPSQDRKAKEEIAFTTIGHRTVLREYVSVQRATGEGETTSVGDDCLLLAYAHVAHNCRVGNFVTMSNLAQLAGHTIVEDHAGIGGMAGVHQYVRIGRHAFVGGMCKLTRDVPPFMLAEGQPAEIHGLNSVGLRRAGFPADGFAELKEIFKTVYRSDRNLSQALVAVREMVRTDEGREFLRFVEAESHRGIVLK